MDLTEHVITDTDVNLEQNQPSDTESIQMHVSLTSKYGSGVLLALLATYTGNYRLFFGVQLCITT